MWVLASEEMISRYVLLRYLSTHSCRGDHFCVYVCVRVYVCVWGCKSQPSAEKRVLLL